jgi:hypothetical protein
MIVGEDPYLISKRRPLDPASRHFIDHDDTAQRVGDPAHPACVAD